MTRSRVRIVLAAILLAGFGLVTNPVRTLAAVPTAEQLAPKLRKFAAGETAVTQVGSPTPVLLDGARSGELAAGDVTGDGQPELVVGASNGKVFVRPLSGTATSFSPFADYAGGLFVAVGNLDGDAADEIVASTASGSPPRYRAFNADGSAAAAEVLTYAPAFDGGVRVAVGNVVGDAANEVITAPGPGAGPHIKVFSAAGVVAAEFFAYEANFAGGVFVASGDLDGDEYDEILVGPGASSSGHIARGFDGDATPKTLPVTQPPLGMQPDVRVAVGVVSGEPSFVLTQRHGNDAEIDLYTLEGTFKRADLFDADGNFSPAIANGELFTLDTGPRLIAISEPTIPDHARRIVTLYGSGLAALVGDSIRLGASTNAVDVPAVAISADDMRFLLIVPAGVAAGGYRVTAGADDNPRQLFADNMLTITAHNPPLRQFVTTAPMGGGPHVRTFTGEGPVGGGFFAGDANQVGVRVARGDIDEDGVDEIITGAPPGRPPTIKVFDPAGNLLKQFDAYDSSFLGGVNVAVGDVAFDSPGNEIVTAPDAGGGPHIKVFTHSANGAHIYSFMGYDPAFNGGVRVATADIDGDSIAEIVIAPGPGGGPHVKALTETGQVLTEFMAYSPAFNGGVFLAGADLTGNGVNEILTAPGAGGGPHIKVFVGPELASEFMAFDPGFSGGVSVGRVGDEIIGPNLIAVGAGPGGGPHVRIVDAAGGEVDSFFVYDPNFRGGVYVAGGIA